MANINEQKIIVIPEGKICDYIDGKTFRNDTPEEYVRQTIEKRLVNEHKYLPTQIKIEYTLRLGSKKPRADIVVFDKNCQEQIQESIRIIIYSSRPNSYYILEWP
jgi:type I restriction enzyme M protein